MLTSMVLRDYLELKVVAGWLAAFVVQLWRRPFFFL